MTKLLLMFTSDHTCANPAGIVSRGAKASELHKFELWLHGPKFLWKEEENWPD